MRANRIMMDNIIIGNRKVKAAFFNSLIAKAGDDIPIERSNHIAEEASKHTKPSHGLYMAQ